MESNKLKQMQAIDTRYRGYSFRSRLEARWAVFLDNLNIHWLYEHEGYYLDGTLYLPDFYLPSFDGGSFLEVKPDKFTDSEMNKVKKLAKASGLKVILAVGVPDCICQEVIYYETIDGVSDFASYYGLMNADQARNSDRMFAFPGYENKDLTISMSHWDCLGELYLNAVDKARSARFEFENYNNY